MKGALRTTLCACVLASGCWNRPISWTPVDSSELAQSVHEWTRSDSLTAGFESRLWLDATCLSPAVRMGISEYQGLKGRDAYQILVEKPGHIDFVVGLTARDPAWDDLDESDGALSVVLVTEDGPERPTLVRRLTLNEASDLRPLFPWISRLATLYLVRFPKPEHPQVLILRVTGTPGLIDLRWELR